MTGPVQPVEPRGGWRPIKGAAPNSPPADEPPRHDPSHLQTTQPRKLPRVSTRGTPAATPADFEETRPQPIMYGSPVSGSPVPVSPPPAGPAPIRPASAFPRADGGPLLALLACLCFLPAGIWSLIDLQQAKRHRAVGDHAAAARSIRNSRTIALAGIGLGLLITILVLLAAVLR